MALRVDDFISGISQRTTLRAGMAISRFNMSAIPEAGVVASHLEKLGQVYPSTAAAIKSVSIFHDHDQQSLNLMDGSLAHIALNAHGMSMNMDLVKAAASYPSWRETPGKNISARATDYEDFLRTATTHEFGHAVLDQAALHRTGIQDITNRDIIDWTARKGIRIKPSEAISFRPFMENDLFEKAQVHTMRTVGAIMEKHMPGILGKPLSELVDNAPFPVNNSAVIQHIGSEYAGTNLHEAWAEMFAAYHMGYAKPQVKRAVEEVHERVIPDYLRRAPKSSGARRILANTIESTRHLFK